MSDGRAMKGIRDELWRRGQLEFLFGVRPIEPPRTGVDKLKEVYRWLGAKWGLGVALVILCHRRFGKTNLGFTKGIELAIRHPRSRIAIIADTKDHAQDLAEQVMPVLLDTCPAELAPRYYKTARKWRFKNGSTIEFFGNEPQQQKRVRGGKFLAIIIEEARDLNYLQEATEAVYKPALRDTAGSQLLIISTAPREEDSEFEHYYREALEDDAALVVKLSENPDYPRSFYEETARDTLGGEFGGDFQREYECQFVHGDDQRLAVPEWTKAAREALTRTVEWGMDWQWFVGLDPGGTDPFGLIWFAYDDKNDHLHVARELRITEQITTTELAARIRAVEASLWKGMPVRPERWGDPSDPTYLFNLDQEQGLRFIGSSNKDLRASIDNVRRDIQARSITIDPSCTQLLIELAMAQWKGNQLKRHKKLGHCDVLMALVYARRNLARRVRAKQAPMPEFPIPGFGPRQPNTDRDKVVRNILSVTNPFTATRARKLPFKWKGSA